MISQLFWLSDELWAQLEPHLPKKQLPRMPGVPYLIADKSYDAGRLRASLRVRGTVPVIPERIN